ncbi:MAG: hypothetical protein JWO92_1064 [Chitinophagaceae bacterium]|nr:hypothetical protein [Chitinophagaceae bacterium]
MKKQIQTFRGIPMKEFQNILRAKSRTTVYSFAKRNGIKTFRRSGKQKGPLLFNLDDINTTINSQQVTLEI